MKFHRCNECSFISSKHDLCVKPDMFDKVKLNWFDIFCLEIGLNRIYERKILPVGKFTLPDWSYHSDFYLFQCPGCRQLSFDYLHGYVSDGLRSGLLFLLCDNCDIMIIVYGNKFYKNTKKPKLLFSHLFLRRQI